MGGATSSVALVRAEWKPYAWLTIFGAVALNALEYANSGVFFFSRQNLPADTTARITTAPPQVEPKWR